MDIGEHAVAAAQERTVTLLLVLVVSFASVAFFATPYPYLAFLPACFVLGIWQLGLRAHWVFYLIVGFIPFEAFQGLSEQYRWLTITRILGIIAVALVFLRALLHKGKLLPLASNLWGWLLIFFTLNGVSVLLSPYKATAAANLQLLFSAYVFFGLGLFFLSRRAQLQAVPVVLALTVTCVAALSIAGYVLHIPQLVMDMREYEIRRAIGGSLNPNHFAKLLIFAVPFCVYFILYARRVAARLAAALMLAINLVAIVLTYSRGGFLVLLVVLVLLLVEHAPKFFRPRHLGFLLFFLLAAGVAVLVLVPSSYWTRQKTLKQGSDEAIEMRRSYLKVGLTVFQANPLLGTGIGTFPELYKDTPWARKYHSTPEGMMRDAHNSYLEILIGTGVIGLVLYLIIAARAVANFVQAYRGFHERQDRSRAALTAAYLTSFLSYLIYFFLMSSVYHKYFWLSLAASQALLTLSRETPAGSGNDLPTEA